eukprot:2706749-Pyramimonas_sp.AAC.1
MLQILGSRRVVEDSTVAVVDMVSASMQEHELKLADKSVALSPLHAVAKQIASRLKRRGVQISPVLQAPYL